jgi:hypothetical protein
MRTASATLSLTASAALALLIANTAPFFVAPTDVQEPGTQPLEASLLGGASSCSGCHGAYDPDVEPYENWQGSMMAHAGRVPVFWAALAIAEGDFPGSGDFCIRCHSPRGWHEGRATPSDGSGLDPVVDADGVECSLCHQLVNPDKSEHNGQQSPPYVANNGAVPAEGYYGGGMQVLAGNNVRYGPYAQTAAGHPFAQSTFHRSSEICGTC